MDIVRIVGTLDKKINTAIILVDMDERVSCILRTHGAYVPPSRFSRSITSAVNLIR